MNEHSNMFFCGIKKDMGGFYMVIMHKYHGLGNDYLVFDPNENQMKLQEREIERLCRRNFGVGADGILYGPLFGDGKIYVDIYNPDGREVEQSGNGVRIFAKYLRDGRIWQMII